MKRVSFGFRGFRRMRRRCLLANGFYKVVGRGVKLNGVRFPAD